MLPYAGLELFLAHNYPRRYDTIVISLYDLMMKATIGADDGLLLGKNVLYYQVNYKFC